MQENVIHMRFRDVASVNLLFAALENSFPLFRTVACESPVEASGKESRDKVFLALKHFSTNFPHNAVDGNS
jgi:hypothetical protein